MYTLTIEMYAFELGNLKFCPIRFVSSSHYEHVTSMYAHIYILWIRISFNSTAELYFTILKGPEKKPLMRDKLDHFKIKIYEGLRMWKLYMCVCGFYCISTF